MRLRSALTRLARVVLPVVYLSLEGSGGAFAFDDASCSEIVTSPQHRSFDFGPGETIDIVRARALDQVSKFAVFEVVGADVGSSRTDDTDVDNNAHSTHFHDSATSRNNDGGLEDDKLSDHSHNTGHSSFSGLVRVKLINEKLNEVSGHQSLDVIAEVTVCRPKASTLMELERRKAARDQVPPQAVDPDKVSWFDPATGEPQLWYWTGPNDTYTFFDKGGYDPMTGDPLKRVDRQFSKDWKALTAKRRKDALDLTARQQRDALLQEQAAAAVRQQAESRATQDAKRLQACDAEAANPNDPRKPAAVAGVTWDDLKAGIAIAIEDCAAAVRLQPDEPRYRYQLARAFGVGEPKRAVPLLKRLVEEHYPAAYDNYGWTLIDRRVGRDDLTGAIRSFEAGAAAGDSDAMMSLAGLMTNDKVDPNFPDEPLQLYRRAAKLGNVEAVAAVARLDAERVQTEQARVQQVEQAREQAIQQQQAAQMMMGIMGGALHNIGRR